MGRVCSVVPGVPGSASRGGVEKSRACGVVGEAERLLARGETSYTPHRCSRTFHSSSTSALLRVP
eukprot:scaffold13391_cov65-Phaeocystis_antarctica.AAC.5